MRSDHRRLHIALGLGPPRCAGPAAPRRLRSPPVAAAVAPPPPQEGSCCFLQFSSTVLVFTSPSGRVRHAARGPLRGPAASQAASLAVSPSLAVFTALLSPSPLSPQVFVVEHRPHPGGVQLLSTMRSDHRCLHVALGTGPPRCAEASCPRRLRRQPVAVAPQPPAHSGCSLRRIARPPLPQAPTTLTLGPSPPHPPSLNSGPWSPPGSYYHHTWPSPSISTWTFASTPPHSSSLNTGPSQPPGFRYPDTGPSRPRRPAPSTPQAWPLQSTGSYYFDTGPSTTLQSTSTGT